MIASNVFLFHAINDIAIVLDPIKLDEGGGAEDPLRRRLAARKRRIELTQKLQDKARAARTSHGDQESRWFLCECSTSIQYLTKSG